MESEPTSLLAYVIDYLTEEHQRLLRQKFSVVNAVDKEQVKAMVNEAIDAYEGGTR